jgi:hypothetical protein
MCIVELQYRYAATQLARVLLEDPRLDLDAKDGAGRTVDDLLRLSVADLRRKHLQLKEEVEKLRGVVDGLKGK